MQIQLKPDHALDQAAAATGKSLPQWFAQIDAWGGPDLGRRDIGQRLLQEKLDPWWMATLNIECEATVGATLSGPLPVEMGRGWRLPCLSGHPE